MPAGSNPRAEHVTSLWIELEQPLTDEVKQEARQRLGERDISPSATAEEQGQKH